MSRFIGNPLRFLLGGTVGAAAGAAYMGYSSLTWVVREVQDLDVRVSEAEKRIEGLEQRVDKNEIKSEVRMRAMEDKMDEWRAQLLAEMEMLRGEVKAATGAKAVVPKRGKSPLPE